MAVKSEKKILGMERETFRQFMGKYGVSLIMVVMIIAIAIYNHRFISGTNLLNVVTQVSINGMLAFGMCLCITIGGIDLTVGAQLALVGVIMGQTITNSGMPIALGVLIGVAVATLFGFINGFLIAKSICSPSWLPCPCSWLSEAPRRSSAAAGDHLRPGR